MTHCECVSVALVIQQTMNMCRIALSSVACLTVPCYFTLDLYHEQQDFRKKDIDFDFL